MRHTIFCCLILGWFSQSLAQTSARPLDEPRLSVHSLIREDIFAGWRSNDQERLAQGAKNLDLLLEKRPSARADLLAWKGGIALYRAVLAHEAGNDAEFTLHYQKARDQFQASRDVDSTAGSTSVMGGSYVLFADRLPETVRGDAWQTCYECYQRLYKMQKEMVDRLPVHMRGELLAGLAQSAQRTGRTTEFESYLDEIIKVLPKTPYGRTAVRWKDDPEAARTGNLSCKTCHAPGRLTRRIAGLANE